MIPSWLHLIAIAALAAGFACAAIVALDEWRHPQRMWIMNLVWPVVSLFGTALTLSAYFAYGRQAARDAAQSQRHAHGEPRGKATAPFAVKVAEGALHCGSGCTLGDICAEWLAFAVPAVAVGLGWKSLFPDKMFAVWIMDYLFAFGFGIVFQYFTIAPMRGLGFAQGLWQAVKADALSLTAWQIGMYAFMALASLWLFRHQLGVRLTTDMPEFWLMMQIAMLCGFATAYPVNWWLVRSGIEDAM